MTLLEYLSVARFRGTSAGEFLHAQLSADIAALAPGEATFACYCSPRGQVIGLLLVCRDDDEYLVAGAAELLPGILTRLEMFVLRSPVEFSAQPGTAVYGIEPGTDISGPGLCRPDGLELRYFLPHGKAVANDNGHFKSLEIRNRVTWLGPETTGKFIPQMLGFDRIGAVSFNKGCYPGQEIVARARYLGKVKRKPLVVRIPETLPLRPAERVQLRRGDAWSESTVIDSVTGEDGSTLCFLLAQAEPESVAEEIRVSDRTYRCATI